MALTGQGQVRSGSCGPRTPECRDDPSNEAPQLCKRAAWKLGSSMVRPRLVIQGDSTASHAVDTRSQSIIAGPYRTCCTFQGCVLLGCKPCSPSALEHPQTV
eukprot:1158922-Pelagomonas_calceolata.AAC.9